VGNDLPNIAGNWYYGDTHYHTVFTRANAYEYGGNYDMTRLSGLAMGMSWTTTNDHTHLLPDINYLDTTLGGLPGQCRSNSNASFVFLPGEEMYLKKAPPIETHFLVYNNDMYISTWSPHLMISGLIAS